MHTSTGKAESKKYNDKVIENKMLHAMIDHMERPTSGFEEVIKNHFKLKKDEIMSEFSMNSLLCTGNLERNLNNIK